MSSLGGLGGGVGSGVGSLGGGGVGSLGGLGGGVGSGVGSLGGGVGSLGGGGVGEEVAGKLSGEVTPLARDGLGMCLSVTTPV